MRVVVWLAFLAVSLVGCVSSDLATSTAHSSALPSGIDRVEGTGKVVLYVAGAYDTMGLYRVDIEFDRDSFTLEQATIGTGGLRLHPLPAKTFVLGESGEGAFQVVPGEMSDQLFSPPGVIPELPEARVSGVWRLVPEISNSNGFRHALLNLNSQDFAIHAHRGYGPRNLGNDKVELLDLMTCYQVEDSHKWLLEGTLNYKDLSESDSRTPWGMVIVDDGTITQVEKDGAVIVSAEPENFGVEYLTKDGKIAYSSRGQESVSLQPRGVVNTGCYYKDIVFLLASTEGGPWIEMFRREGDRYVFLQRDRPLIDDEFLSGAFCAAD